MRTLALQGVLNTRIHISLRISRDLVLQSYIAIAVEATGNAATGADEDELKMIDERSDQKPLYGTVGSAVQMRGNY